MSYQGERLGQLPRGIHAHTFLIEPSPDVVRVTFQSLMGETMTEEYSRAVIRDRQGHEHDSEAVFYFHNIAHQIKTDAERREDEMKRTELDLPTNIELQHQE